jgi:endopolyphosphatase
MKNYLLQSLLQEAFSFLSTISPKPDFVLWTGRQLTDNSTYCCYRTGDSADHHSASHSAKKTLATIAEISNFFSQYLPGRIDHLSLATTHHSFSEEVPVFPCIGNHDVFPVDQVKPPSRDPSKYREWFAKIWDVWQQWIPVSAQQTFLRGGYYTTMILPGNTVLIDMYREKNMSLGVQEFA